MLAGIEVNFSLIVNIIRTLIDLLLVWYILYLGISMFKQNMRTMQLFKGVLIILLIKLVTSVLGLSTMSYLVDTVLTWGLLPSLLFSNRKFVLYLKKWDKRKESIIWIIYLMIKRNICSMKLLIQLQSFRKLKQEL